MCGRYALSLRPSAVRRRLQDENMPVDDPPDQDDNDNDNDNNTRQTYNFAPGNHGLVYRANVPDSGAGTQPEDKDKTATVDGAATTETRYKLQAMKWGLIPFWTKRAPDYSNMMRTINCRDDSLATSGGLWNTMKQRKRCIVVCEGFYEWLKKNNGKDRVPHYVKRKDGQLMCFAGLWDCVQYEGHPDKLYTYTIITTDSNKQLKFLHDRMPVIFNNGSDALKTWLDPARSEWSTELQSLLKPYDGELECYQVDKAVGKVGNNSPSFIIPIDSKDNKNNIANFFGNQKKQAKSANEESLVKKEEDDFYATEGQVKQEPDEDRSTVIDANNTEDNAPRPQVSQSSDQTKSTAVKREHSPDVIDQEPSPKVQKPTSGRTMRSSVTNNTQAKSPPKAKDGSQKITNFFAK
jgi:putative SOS response-associated peptidase YedK